MQCLPVQVGPRLELELVKVEDGLAEGRVLYHRYESRSKEAVAAKEVARAEAERLKAARRHEQEANVRRKAAEQARVEKAKQGRCPTPRAHPALFPGCKVGGSILLQSGHRVAQFGLILHNLAYLRQQSTGVCRIHPYAASEDACSML